MLDSCEANAERSVRVVKVADCESTGRGFEYTVAPLVTCVKALNKFALNLHVPVHLAV